MYLHIKRALDFILAGLALIVLSPVLLVIAILIRATSPGPVLFSQKRVGIHKTHIMTVSYTNLRAPETIRDLG